VREPQDWKLLQRHRRAMKISSPISAGGSMSEITQRIRSAGYWEVDIHPATFKKDRIPNVLDLFPIVERSKVEVRGWDFPHINRREHPVPHLDFVQQESEWEHHAERWRLFQSGQFAMLRAFAEDWRDRSGWWPPGKDWKRGGRLGIGDALFTLFEIYEFAARLSNTPAGDERMVVNIDVGGLKGRALEVDDPNRIPFIAERHSQIASYPIRTSPSRSDLLANSTDLALQAARELFQRFGRDMSIDRLRDWLPKLRRG
jgi:hypothetical protein